MPRQVVARVLLVAAVLLAQQTALAHDFWHAAASQGVAQPKSPDGKKLCDLHDLLGTVLGVVNAAPAHAELLSLSESGFFSIAPRAAENRPLVAQSRGPPPAS